MFLSRAYQLSGFSWLTCWIGTPRNTSALFTVTSNDMISPHNHTLLTPHACTLDRHETYDSRTLAVESIHLIQLGLSIELKLRPSPDVEKQCSTCTWRKKIRYNTICNTWYARIHCDLINKQTTTAYPSRYCGVVLRLSTLYRGDWRYGVSFRRCAIHLRRIARQWHVKQRVTRKYHIHSALRACHFIQGNLHQTNFSTYM